MINIPAGKILTITGANSSSGNAWWYKSGSDLVLAGSIGTTPLILGPYINDVDVELIMSAGSYTAEFNDETSQVPTTLASRISTQNRAAAVGQATDETDVAARFNELLVALRASGALTTGNPPANTVLPAITGTEEVGETLTVSNGTWTGDATITYARQWKRDGVNIASATAATYLLVEADDGTEISCTVTATNSVGSVSATADAVGPITTP